MESSGRSPAERLSTVRQWATTTGMVVLLSACSTQAVGSFGKESPAAGARSCPGPGGASASDPIVTDGDKYRVVLENDHVRVLRYRDKPGAKTHPHHHDEFVLYALSSFRRRLVFSDGAVKERDFKPGDAIWMPAQVHTGENIGTTDTDVVIVEQKPPCTSARPSRPDADGEGGEDHGKI